MKLLKQLLEVAKQRTIVIGEIEHSNDAINTIDDLKKAGCEIISHKVSNQNETMTVVAKLPSDVKTIDDLQKKCKFACIWQLSEAR